MIIGKVTAKAQVTVPLAIRRALDVQAGDELVWEIDNDRVVVSKAGGQPFANDFTAFTEWASPADCAAFDNL